MLGRLWSPRNDGWLSAVDKPGKMRLILLQTISLVLLLVGCDADEQQQLPADEELEWEYEPRLWSLDVESETTDSISLDLAPSQETSEEGESNQEVDPTPGIDPHLRHNYLNLDLVELRQQQDECTQFRVDTREAVICDKKRCDKLDFEWPKFDDQLTVIQSTKHGMRFHRADFAFAKQSTRAARLWEPQRETIRGKPFDIFEIFKPKTTTTTTTTTTTASPTTTTAAPETTTPEPETTTATSPAETTTTAAQETTTPSEAAETTTSDSDVTEAPASAARVVALAQLQDTNTTQLVTTFRLDTRRTRNTIIGFGGALSDSTCRNIRSLSPAMSKSLMEDYFGQRGLRYNMVRLTIGSSDFSTTPYTNNDQTEQVRRLRGPSKGDDVEMNNFRLTSEDYEFKLPVIRQAIATSQQEIKFFASLWSPPVWMKNNSDIVHGFLKGDIYGPYYKALAELIIKWLEAYRRNGIEMWGLTGLNEPVTGIKPFINHNSLGISKEDYVLFYKLYLGPMLRQRAFQSVKLMALDDNKGYAPFWVKTLLEDSEAAKYISGIAFHWYMNDEYENLNFLAKNHTDKFILATEACNGFLPFQVHALPGNWERGVAYMLDIIKMMQKSSSGWVDWNMALDLYGGPTWAKNNLDAAIIVNAKRDEYYKSPMFYAIGHFSRYVVPGSVRLDHRLANARYDYPFEAVTFLTPNNHVVIVVLNANKHPVPFKIVADRKLVRIVTLRAESFSTLIFKANRK